MHHIFSRVGQRPIFHAARMGKLILRVDDCGWTPDKADDRGLAYFREWRDAFGIAGCPVYYGFIPTTLGVRELAWLVDNLTAEEVVSVHGWDHERGPVSAERMHLALDLFRGASLSPAYYPTYIPPFNAYDHQTLSDWRNAGFFTGRHGGTRAQAVFFGGFHDDAQSLDFGPEPAIVCTDLLHIPAFKPLYERAGPILERLPQYLDCPYPLVVTLHATWDAKNLAALRPLRDALAPHLVTVEEALKWTQRKNG